MVPPNCPDAWAETVGHALMWFASCLKSEVGGKGPVPLQTGATRTVIGWIQSLEHIEKPKAMQREFSYVFWVSSGFR